VARTRAVDVLDRAGEYLVGVAGGFAHVPAMWILGELLW
jgi:hypothetical protein